MATNPARGISEEDLRNRFNYHPPRDQSDVAVHEDVRNELHGVAQTMNSLLPDGREKSVVMTKIEEAMFWANAALARARGVDPVARIP